MTTGVKALSIWMYPTGKCRYTALPKESVEAIACGLHVRGIGEFGAAWRRRRGLRGQAMWLDDPSRA